MKRSVFFVSDRTGVTAEMLGESLLTQFPGIEFERTNIPFVTNESAAHSAAGRIAEAATQDNLPPLVFSTLTDTAIQKIIASSTKFVFDLFGTFVKPLENALDQESSRTAGQMHGIGDSGAYERRLQALNFTLNHDDGLHLRSLNDSEIILVGVSRCGKTPTCLYLAMNYSLKTANYPLTDDDFDQKVLPKILEPVREKLYGLTIVPEQLSRIRHERRPHGNYATLAQCRSEVAKAEALFNSENIQFLDTTTISIEEIAATIGRDMGLR